MRTPLLAVLLAAALSMSTAAELSLGCRAGLGLATISGDVEDEFLTLQPGFTASLDVHTSLNEWAAFEAGVSYVTRGARWSYDESDARDKVQARYLDIPVAMSFRLPREWVVLPYASIGAVLGFFLGADREVSIDGNEAYSSTLNEGARNVDVGINLGGGATMPLGGGRARLDINYTWGLLTVDTSSDEWVTNRVLSFTLGYLWTLTKGDAE